MLAKHRELGITPEQRLRFATLMSLAADDAGLPDDPEFRSALVAYLEWGTRLAMHNSQPGADVARARARAALGLGRGPALQAIAASPGGRRARRRHIAPSISGVPWPRPPSSPAPAPESAGRWPWSSPGADTTCSWPPEGWMSWSASATRSLPPILRGGLRSASSMSPTMPTSRRRSPRRRKSSADATSWWPTRVSGAQGRLAKAGWRATAG